MSCLVFRSIGRIVVDTRFCHKIISHTMADIQMLQQNSAKADQLIVDLKQQIQLANDNKVLIACRLEEEKLQRDNEQLRKEVEALKKKLVAAEIRNGVKQVALPSQKLKKEATSSIGPNQATSIAVCPAKPSPKETTGLADGKTNVPTPEKRSKKAESKPTKDVQSGGAADDSIPVDVSRLDMRIGLIVSAKKHPDADGLYVEEVDLGEGTNRTIVSGLVKHVPLEQMQNRLAVFLCNLKAAKMRGINSEGMIMCASTPEKVEILEVPPGANVGERISVEGYPGVPDKLMNPKKKIWEQVQPDLKVNDAGLATYKGALWKIDGKGTFSAPTLRNVNIK